MRRVLTYTLVLWLVWSPSVAFAQFIPIEQARQQEQITEAAKVEGILSDIEAEGNEARRRVQVLLAQASSGKSTIAGTGRQIDTITGGLKSDLNKLLNDYAKTNPGTAAIKAAFSASQETLNSVRRQASEALDQLGFDKAADPNALTGKYLQYQTKIKGIVERNLARADERLQEPGRRQTVKADLNKYIEEASRNMEIATTSFMTTNPELLPAAIQRIKKEQLDLLSKGMHERLKVADKLSNDKVLDLTEEELKAVEAASAEMKGIVDRAIQTIDGLMKQVAAANLPTSTNEAGVNPQLEAKFKVAEQAREIRRESNLRLEKVKERFIARKNVSQTAKDVFTREYTQAKRSLNDTAGEYQDYFTVGDPSKAQYEDEKDRLQDAADGCDGFFCTVGRVVAGVGSAVLKSSTGIDLAPQSISSGIFGISDGDPRAYRGAYSNTYGAYVAGSGGIATTGLGSSCYSYDQVPTKSIVELLIPKAQAQLIPNGTVNNTVNNAIGGSGSIPGASTRTEEQSGGYTQSTGNAGTYNPSTGSSRSSSSSSSTSGVSGFLKNVWNSGYIRDAQGNIVKDSTGRPVGNTIANTLSGILNGSLNRQYGQGCFGQTNPYGGLPGTYNTYYSPFGGYPVGQALGYPSNSVGFNSAITATTYSTTLANGLELMAKTDTTLDAAKQKAYQEAAAILRDPYTSDSQKLVKVREKLNTIGFFVQTDPRMNSIMNMFVNLCVNGVTNGAVNNQQVIDFCRNQFPATGTGSNTTPGIISPLSTTGTPVSAAAAQISQLNARIVVVSSEISSGSLSGTAKKAEVCKARESEISAVESQLVTLKDTAVANAATLLQPYLMVIQSIGVVRRSCQTESVPTAANISSGLLPADQSTVRQVQLIVDSLGAIQCTTSTRAALGRAYQALLQIQQTYDKWRGFGVNIDAVDQMVTRLENYLNNQCTDTVAGLGTAGNPTLFTGLGSTGISAGVTTGGSAPEVRLTKASSGLWSPGTFKVTLGLGSTTYSVTLDDSGSKLLGQNVPAGAYKVYVESGESNGGVLLPNTFTITPSTRCGILQVSSSIGFFKNSTTYSLMPSSDPC